MKAGTFCKPNYPTGEAISVPFYALINDDYLDSEPAYNVLRDKVANFKLLKLLNRPSEKLASL